MAATIFIDGEVGTTGLQIRNRLEGRTDFTLISLPDDQRKDPARRAEMLNRADLAILCLPDEASREAVSLIENPNVRVIDASSAHRVTPGWVYGMPEFDADQTSKIASAKRVSNPGCYACSSVALIHPLVSAGIMAQDHAVTINAISGYSGGGRQMIEQFEDPKSENPLSDAFFVYGLGLEHKHVAEIQTHGGLSHRPLFMPSVGRYAQGMIVQLPLQLDCLPGSPTPQQLHDAYQAHYGGSKFVSVKSMQAVADMSRLSPEGLNGTNQLHIHVFGNEKHGQAVVVALLDNLGKGASGQAVQNLNIMFGLDEATGLE